jgi:hypothetical protein
VGFVDSIWRSFTQRVAVASMSAAIAGDRHAQEQGTNE